MIPRANITAWRSGAPWPDNAQVEQDLVLSRALVAMFACPAVAEQAVFRGGTALHKLFFDPPGRYSEDLDLVQRNAGPIGGLVNAIREALDPWLGEPKWKHGAGRFTLSYRFDTSFAPVVQMRLKVEINTREHFNVLGLEQRGYSVTNPWFSGEAAITTYGLTEMLGTKMRALYQRKKGRDLFDLWFALAEQNVDPEQVVQCFVQYLAFGKAVATRAQFEQNVAGKMDDGLFLEDINPMLRSGVEYDAHAAWDLVHESLVSRLPGAPWKGQEARAVQDR